MVYEIVYSPEAAEHLVALSKTDQVEQQLAREPVLPTLKRKVLRPNPTAPWELRLGDIRVFYDVQERPSPMVSVKALGKKVHNAL